MAEDTIKDALERLGARQPPYVLYDQYYAGIHNLAFASEKFRSAFGRYFQTFTDNLCPSVCDTLADRLIVLGFAVETANDTDNTRITDEIMAIWNTNRMDRQSGQVHLEAIRSGDSYVIVWPDGDNRPVFYPNRALTMTVLYDDDIPGQINWAAKLWQQDDRTFRLTLYYPDRIEKYVTTKASDTAPKKATEFVPYELPSEAWPLVNPWNQVPVFHFANNQSSDRFGRSELADVVPLQDALNKTLIDKLVAQEFAAFRQRWATGLEVPVNEETGKPVEPFKAAVDRLWTVSDKDTRFGDFDATDLSQLEQSAEGWRKEIATVSRTPLHYVIPPTGTWPSGEALKTAEGPFTAKAKDRTVAFGNAWEDAMQLAYKMALDSAEEGDLPLSCQWRNVEPRSESDMFANVQKLTQSGMALRWALVAAGFDDEAAERYSQADVIVPGLSQ